MVILDAAGGLRNYGPSLREVCTNGWAQFGATPIGLRTVS